MTGIEIGPLTAPLVSKDDGTIFYVDHADTETLRRKYELAPDTDPAQIVPVDMVWGQRTLQECLGVDCKIDYVVNAHVVEHVPDLVTWLAEIHSVLKPGGWLRMAIPDRRYTFDFLRAESTLLDALDAYVRKPRAPSPRVILDHFLHYADIDVEKAWQGKLARDRIHPAHTPEFAIETAERFFRSGDYQDVHCWVFTPRTFAELCLELVRLELLSFTCDALYPTEKRDIEFIVSMRAAETSAECTASWRDALERC